ncbi:MAG: magnesium/cobalt efflux protein [Coxiella sp. RIFCSPHIGHO2_12_FULL_44_14]|nr:MAG: magnesium/cobalt efflux protein [Coxiella sp. RIFCSPHIGHO2_12_FULL_44_14]
MNKKNRPRKSWTDRLSQALLPKPRDQKQLVKFLRMTKDRKLLNPDSLAMIEGVLKVAEMKARDIMISRAQMIIAEYDATVQQTIPIVTESAHSRFPVIGESRDKVIGILLAKDLLQYIFEEKQEKIQIKDILRPAFFIPESKRLEVLLKEFRLNRNHMAIVIDEYGTVAGLITIEDILEQIVGEIEDEYDITNQEPNIQPLGQNEYTIKALTPLDEFNEYFGTKISEQECDTIGGYLIQQLGHMPKRGESIKMDTLQITVALASKRQIQWLRLKKNIES